VQLPHPLIKMHQVMLKLWSILLKQLVLIREVLLLELQ
jgi:hypothetical protein